MRCLSAGGGRPRDLGAPRGGLDDAEEDGPARCAAAGGGRQVERTDLLADGRAGGHEEGPLALTGDDEQAEQGGDQ